MNFCRFAVKVLKKQPTTQSPGQFRLRSGSQTASGILDIESEPESTDPATVGLPPAIRREIDVMKVLAHKNLVRLIEIISDPECEFFYMVLEHIEGGPIMIYNQAKNRFVHSMTGRVMGESTARFSFHL
jgi:serine/threonine protein kinase